MNQTLSLASNVSDPPLPFFSKDTIVYAVQTIVDGFLDRCSTLFLFMKLFSYSVYFAFRSLLTVLLQR